MSKICTKCGLEKSFSEFSQNTPTKKDGYNSWCKQCCYESSRNWVLTPRGIYSQLKARQTYYKKRWPTRHKPVKISCESFVYWYEDEPKNCIYCDINENDLNLVVDYLSGHALRLAIDCKDNDLGYIEGNLALACDRCNQTKNNLLTYEEMLYVGKNFIKPKWMKIKEKLEAI